MKLFGRVEERLIRCTVYNEVRRGLTEPPKKVKRKPRVDLARARFEFFNRRSQDLFAAAFDLRLTDLAQLNKHVVERLGADVLHVVLDRVAPVGAFVFLTLIKAAEEKRLG